MTSISALNRRSPKNRRQKIIDGEKEAYLIAIACSPKGYRSAYETPCGKSNWTLRMLADKIGVIQDQLNTHVKASLYKAFEPEVY